MLGYGWLGYVQWLNELKHASRTSEQAQHDGHPRGISQRTHALHGRNHLLGHKRSLRCHRIATISSCATAA
jgi:hypothetical protein